MQSINPVLNICVSARLMGCKLLRVWLAMCYSRFVWRFLQNKWRSQNQAAAVLVWIKFSSFSFHISPSPHNSTWLWLKGLRRCCCCCSVLGKGSSEWPAGRCQWWVSRAVWWFSIGTGGRQLQGTSQSEQDHKPWKSGSSFVLRSSLSGEKMTF